MFSFQYGSCRVCLQVIDRVYTSIDGLLADVALMYSNAQAIKHEQASNSRRTIYSGG